MNLRSALAPAAILLVLAASNAVAQNPPPAPWGPSKTNAARLRWLQYTMAAGRITVSSAYHGTNMTLGPLEIERRRERLQIQINPAAINLRYDLATADEQLRIELIESNQLRIRRARSSPQYELVFEQAPDKPLVLVIDTPQGKYRLNGPGFWHLYLAEPELVRRHLIPLLEILHPSWQLASVGEAIEGTLIARAQHAPVATIEDWARLVDRLASPKFSERETAQRELAAEGPVVVPYLQGLDRRRLDAEQAARIRSLIDSLSADNEDSADRVAVWLAGDYQIWLSLAARTEAAKRRVAKTQLEQLAGAAIEFDPSADEAVRREQLRQLRERFERAAADRGR